MKYIKNYDNFILESLDYFKQELTTLIGLDIPEFVDGDFICAVNKLINLKGSPREVSGNFKCYGNKLTSLVGAPRKVGGHFNCINNKLTTLEYLPEIGGKLFCYSNPWIKPIPYNTIIKYDLPLKQSKWKSTWVYTDEQYNEFSSLEFQKEFLEREPENFIDLKPCGYAKGIEELFPHLFDMDELGLLD